MPAPASIASYRGRFAPTPSGALHLGSLLTALASWLDARAARGRWLLRIDDLDHARCPPDAESRILRQLEAHGLTWDEAPRRQSRHLAEYEAALEKLAATGRVYPCSCTRALLARLSLPGADGLVYAGTCRNGPQGRGPTALRLRLGDDHETLGFEDRIQGPFQRSAGRDVGDFILRRNDGIFGYHLACAVDEHAQRITDVVRGADLLPSTLCHRLLLEALGHPAPRYAHLPLLLDGSGQKLSKQNHAQPIDEQHAPQTLLLCLQLLGQATPPGFERAGVAEILAFAVAHWRTETVPKQRALAGYPRMSYTSSPASSGIL